MGCSQSRSDIAFERPSADMGDDLGRAIEVEIPNMDEFLSNANIAEAIDRLQNIYIIPRVSIKHLAPVKVTYI